MTDMLFFSVGFWRKAMGSYWFRLLVLLSSLLSSLLLIGHLFASHFNPWILFSYRVNNALKSNSEIGEGKNHPFPTWYMDINTTQNDKIRHTKSTTLSTNQRKIFFDLAFALCSPWTLRLLHFQFGLPANFYLGSSSWAPYLGRALRSSFNSTFWLQPCTSIPVQHLDLSSGNDPHPPIRVRTWSNRS